MWELFLLYFCIGVVFGISLESLMSEVDMNDTTTNTERFLWVILWPMFILIFIFGTKK
jgi:hypothetical protein